MKKVNAIILILLCLFSFNHSFAFDGKREGFVLGVGLGFGAVNPQGTGDRKNVSSPLISGTLSYGFNDYFQLGFGKKVLSFKYNNKTVYQELGGIVVDFFIEDYYLTLGSGISSATNKISLDNYLLGDASFLGIGYEFTSGFNVELVTGNAKFNTTGSSVVTPEKEVFYGVLLTTYFY